MEIRSTSLKLGSLVKLAGVKANPEKFCGVPPLMQNFSREPGFSWVSFGVLGSPTTRQTTSTQRGRAKAENIPFLPWSAANFLIVLRKEETRLEKREECIKKTPLVEKANQPQAEKPQNGWLERRW